MSPAVLISCSLLALPMYVMSHLEMHASLAVNVRAEQTVTGPSLRVQGLKSWGFRDQLV